MTNAAWSCKFCGHENRAETMDDSPTLLEELEATRAALRRLIAAVEAEDQDTLAADPSLEVSAALSEARGVLGGERSA